MNSKNYECFFFVMKIMNFVLQSKLRFKLHVYPQSSVRDRHVAGTDHEDRDDGLGVCQPDSARYELVWCAIMIQNLNKVAVARETLVV